MNILLEFRMKSVSYTHLDVYKRQVKNYVSIDVLGIYLRDFGIQLGYAMDNPQIVSRSLISMQQLETICNNACICWCAQTQHCARPLLREFKS